MGRKGAVTVLQPESLEVRVDQIVTEHVNPRGPGLAVLVARDQDVLVHKAYGLADVESGRPLAPDDRFVIGSVTKQFACMAVMLLHHDGRVGYDDPVGRYLPEMPTAWRERITVRQLMHHTSGVPEYLTGDFWENGEDYPDLGALLRLIAAFDELEFEPGTRWRYCNSGYIMLGEIVARAADQSFADYLRHRVFEPLGMADTEVGVNADWLPGLATGYMYEDQEHAERAPWNFSVVGGADGNIISGAADLHRWAVAQRASVLLPPASSSLALVPCRPWDLSFSRYGFGLEITERRGVREVSHGGGTLGYWTHLASFPDERLVVVLLSNAAGIDLTRIRGRIATALLEDKMAPLVPAVVSPGMIEDKIGIWAGLPRDQKVVAEIAAGGSPEQLTATIKHGDQRVERHALMPLGRDLFCVDPVSNSYMQFTRSAGGLDGLRLTNGGMVINLKPARAGQ